MPGPTQPWDQSEDPRENTVDLPRIDLAGLADYFRGAAPPPRPNAQAQPLAGPAEADGPAESPAVIAEPQGQASQAEPGSHADPSPAAGNGSTTAASTTGGSTTAGSAPAAGSAGESRGAAGAAPAEYGSLMAAGPAAPGDVAAGPGPASYGPPSRPAPGSLVDLRSRLSRLPAGHPSSPYDDGGQARPVPTRLKHLELGLPAPGREPGDVSAPGDSGVWEAGHSVGTPPPATAATADLNATAARHTTSAASPTPTAAGPTQTPTATGRTAERADQTPAGRPTEGANHTAEGAAELDPLNDPLQPSSDRPPEGVRDVRRAALPEQEPLADADERAPNAAAQNGSAGRADGRRHSQLQDPYAVDPAENGYPHRDSGSGFQRNPAALGDLGLRPWTGESPGDGRRQTNGTVNGNGNGHDRQIRPEFGRADFGPADRDWRDASQPHAWPLGQLGPDHDLPRDRSLPPDRSIPPNGSLRPDRDLPPLPPLSDRSHPLDRSHPRDRSFPPDSDLAPDASFPHDRDLPPLPPPPDRSHPLDRSHPRDRSFAPHSDLAPDRSFPHDRDLPPLPPERDLPPDRNPWPDRSLRPLERERFDNWRSESRQRDTVQGPLRRDSRRPDISRPHLGPPQGPRSSAPPPRTPPPSTPPPSGSRPSAPPFGAYDLTDLVERTLAACRAAEGRNMFDNYGSSGLTPAIQRLAAQLPAGGLAPGSEADSLKPAVRFAAKLAKLIARNPGRPPEELAASISDAVRYAFAFEPDDYTECTWLVHRKLKTQGFELEVRRNRWESPEHKGIFTRWRDPAHGISFEVQFHTMASWTAAKRAHDAYASITDPATPASERAQLRARQVLAAATAIAPAGCMEIEDFRAEQR